LHGRDKIKSDLYHGPDTEGCRPAKARAPGKLRQMYFHSVALVLVGRNSVLTAPSVDTGPPSREDLDGPRSDHRPAPRLAGCCPPGEGGVCYHAGDEKTIAATGDYGLLSIST
jgi:hypothetical protein